MKLHSNSNKFNVGQRFGHLMILGLGRRRTRPCGVSVLYWRVRCDCGREFERASGSISSKHRKEPQSCGCAVPKQVARRATSHGLKKHKSYDAWCSMMKRCSSRSDKFYRRYGARGIVVCDRWHDINNFIADMGERPPNTTLDRIDNDGNYDPDNCRWATVKQQARNKSSNRVLTANGEQKLLCDWAAQLGCRPSSILSRIAHGWSVEAAVTTPIARRFR